MKDYSFIYGEESISFSLQFQPNLKHRIRIHIMPDGAVQVDAPEGATPQEVRQAVCMRAQWIWNQLQERRVRMQHVLPREYVSGETHLYLGRRYLLKVRAAQGERPVRLWRGRLEIATVKRDAFTVRRLLEGWYRERANDVFDHVLQDMVERTGLRRDLPSFRLRSMKTQWGSCSPKGHVLLNPHLVKAPKVCIEYVVAHELCHLKEHNHSKQFYKLLEHTLPDWAARKTELDSLAEQLFNR